MLMQSQRTQVCTLVQTGLSMLEVSFFFYLAMLSLYYLKEEIIILVFESFEKPNVIFFLGAS